MNHANWPDEDIPKAGCDWSRCLSRRVRLGYHMGYDQWERLAFSMDSILDWTYKNRTIRSSRSCDAMVSVVQCHQLSYPS